MTITKEGDKINLTTSSIKSIHNFCAKNNCRVEFHVRGGKKKIKIYRTAEDWI